MIMKKTGKIFYALLLVFIFCMCIADYHCIAKAVTDALKRCLCTLIPSLYAVMTVSYLITESGVVSLFPKWSEKISEKLLVETVLPKWITLEEITTVNEYIRKIILYYIDSTIFK